MAKAIKVGDCVKIASLNREGFVLELLKDNFVKVSLGNLPITVSLADLTFVSKRSKMDTNIGKIKTNFLDTSESEELDLHAKNTEEALRQIEDKINKALMYKMHRLKIIHGIGSGKIKEILHEYLSNSAYVQRFSIDDFNPGVTWVFL